MGVRTPYAPFSREVNGMEMRETDAAPWVSSLEKVSARMIEAVLRNAQMAAAATPEMQELFGEWVSCLEAQVLAELEEGGDVDLESWGERIGLRPSSVAALLLTLHRRGSLTIRRITVERGSGENEDLCSCLR